MSAAGRRTAVDKAVHKAVPKRALAAGALAVSLSQVHLHMILSFSADSVRSV